jgi:hypothetical protein
VIARWRATLDMEARSQCAATLIAVDGRANSTEMIKAPELVNTRECRRKQCQHFPKTAETFALGAKTLPTASATAMA